MARPHHLVLVPGFFGFANLGDFAYFTHVRELLGELAPPLGLEGEIRAVHTEPTASLPRRAAILAETVAGLLDQADGDVTLIGHSSGGLDARLLVAPRVSLPTLADVERCASRVRAVITVSAPHRGTPLAHLFGSLLGQQLLGLLSLATIHALRTGRLPLAVALRLAGLVRRPGSKPTGVLDQLFLQLLADFSVARRRAVEQFFAHVQRDQGLVEQITPAGMELFNASTPPRPGVRYASVVTRARKPGLRSLVRAGFDPYAQATHALYIGLHRFAARTPRGQLSHFSAPQADALRRVYGRIPAPSANDGIVPTLSQVWGDVIAAVWADHHDVIGHFHQPTHVPPHFDWVASGTGFDRAAFEAVWHSVALYAATAARS